MGELAMSAIQVEHYLKRAADFSYVVLLLRGDASHRYSSALLAIHAAISYSDALRIGLGDNKLGRDDHNAAADALKQILASSNLSDETGLSHLRYLLSNKSLVAYGDQRISAKDFEMVFTKAERFAKWANRIGQEMKIEGWVNDSQ
jgi:hypothetical protein